MARRTLPRRTVTATPPITAKGGMSSAGSAAAARTSGTMAGPVRMTVGTSALMPHGLTVGLPPGQDLLRSSVAQSREVEGGGNGVDHGPSVVAAFMRHRALGCCHLVDDGDGDRGCGRQRIG